MKKIILTSVTCLFLSSIGYTQGTSLESFFNHYSEQKGFTYIYDGRENRVKSYAARYEKQLKNVKFSQTLICDTVPTDFVENLKEILKKEGFELVQKTKDDKSRIETHQRVLDEDFDEVKFVVYDTKIHVSWVSGRAR